MFFLVHSLPLIASAILFGSFPACSLTCPRLHKIVLLWQRKMLMSIWDSNAPYFMCLAVKSFSRVTLLGLIEEGKYRRQNNPGHPQPCKDRCFEAYYCVSDWWDWNGPIINLDVGIGPSYNEILRYNELFFKPRNSKIYGNMKKKLDIS